MNNIADQQIAARGDLNLNSETSDERLVVPNAFNPVDSACFDPDPIFGSRERRIDCLANTRRTVRLRRFFENDRRAEKDLLKLEEKIS